MAEDKKTDLEGDFVYKLAIGLFIFLVGAVVLKRSPELLIGATIGFSMISTCNSREGLVSKFRAALGTFVTCYGVLFVLFGIQGLIHSDFPGFLVYFGWYQDFVFSIVNFWNGNMLKNFRVPISSINTQVTSRFIFINTLVGTALAYIGPSLYQTFLPEAKKTTWLTLFDAGIFKRIAEIPYFFFQILIEKPVKFFVRYAHSLAVSIRGKTFSELGSLLIVVLVISAISFCFSKLPDLLSLKSKDLILIINTGLVYAPITVFLGSFIIGLIPFLGDTTLYHLFESHPLGAQIAGVTKKAAPGFCLGKNGRNKSFYLTENNLAYHVEIVAPTGSGKTNILKNLICDRIQKGHGVIFIDYKADFDVLTWMYRAAKAFDREKELRLISLANPDLSVPYNPLEGGTSSELTSRLLNSFEWSSEQYYLNASKSALSRVMRGFVEYRELTGSSFNVGHVHKALTDSNYLRVIGGVLRENNKLYATDLFEIAQKVDKPSEAKEIRGLISNLESLMFSSVGSLLTSDTEHGSYGLDEAVGSSRITYCLMNSLLLKESSKALGKLFLQDLMSFVGRRFASIESKNQTNKPITLIIDEFAAFAIPEFIDFLDRARSAGISVIIAHQDRADLKSISDEFQSRVEANTNTTVVSGVKDPKDAEHFAGMIGTRETVKETWQESDGFFGATPTGVKSKRVVDEYVIHPNDIKQLKRGEVLAIARNVDQHFGMVRVAKADEFLKVHAPTAELLQLFKTTRESYIQGNGINKFTNLNASRPGLKTEETSGFEQSPVRDIWS